MKIIYFTQFFKPENIAPAFRAYDNAINWKNMGHEVTIFTGYPNYPVGKIFDGYNAKLYSEEKIDGIRVIRSKLVARPNTSIVRRLVNMFSYFFFGLINVLFNRKIGKDYDVVLGTSGLIFNALLAWIYAKMHRKRFVFEIRDITYRQLIATGKSEKSMGVKVMRGLELFLCKKAKRVVVVTEGFKKELAMAGIDPDKIVVLTNGVNEVSLHEHRFDQGVVFSYMGTLGLSQDIPGSIDYIGELKKHCDNIKYLIIGEGATKGQIVSRVNDDRLDYVKVMNGMSMDELEKYYDETNMSVVTLKKSDDFKYTIPSKIFQCMGRGIPVLFIGPEGEAADIIRKNNAGIALTKDTRDDVRELVSFFSQDDYKEKLCKMGENGYNVAKEKYTRKKIAERYIDVLKG